MPAFQDEFTASLAMWSPPVTSSVFTYSSPVVSQKTVGYYHEPVYYPVACIICGLLHHPVSYHKTKTFGNTSVIVTPIPYQPKNQIKVEQKSFPVSRSNRRVFRKNILDYVQRAVCWFISVIRKPFKGARKFNIYPTKKTVRLSA